MKLAFLLGLALHFSESYAQIEGASASREIVIWYRASQGCPSGAEFVSGIRVEGRTTRLARVGDHVDYVITLESDGSASGGSLERQTEKGTIAISELRGGACSEVAEALALSLMLAVTPSQSATTPGPPAPPAAVDDPASAPESADSAGRPALAKPADSVEKGPAVSRRAPSTVAEPVVPRWWIGGGFEGGLGMTPDPSFGAQLFVAYDWALVSPRRSASVRVGPAAVYSRTPIEDLGHVDQWITTLELEFCPLTLRSGSLGVAPCVVGESGLFVASTTRETSLTSVNFWGAAGPAVRGRAQVVRGLELGLTAAVKAPFSRLELIAGEEVLYRTPPAAFSLGADLSWAIP